MKTHFRNLLPRFSLSLSLTIVVIIPTMSLAGPLSPSLTNSDDANGALVAKAPMALPEKALPTKTLPTKKRRSKNSKLAGNTSENEEPKASANVGSNTSSNTKGGKPSQLPTFKGSKKVKIDFSDSAESHATTVVVRTPLPLEKAIEDQNAAERKVHDSTNTQTNVSDVRSKTIVLSNESDLVVDEGKGTILLGSETGSEVSSEAGSKAESQAGATETRFETSKTSIQESELQTSTVTVTKSSLPSPESATRVRISTPTVVNTERRFYFKSGYLAAEYSKIERDLRNGATTFAFGVGQTFGSTELRASLEIGHGLDQSVTPENTRLLLARADVSHFFTPGVISPFVNGGFGLARHVVRSYRKSSAEPQILLREHLAGTSMAFIPGGGLRLELTKEVALETTLEYAVMLGANSASTGGFALGAAIGWNY